MVDRDKIFQEYNKIITKGRKNKNKDVFNKLARQWFSQKYPSFFTTRRILLGKYAEEFLVKSSYNG